jgi:hypothetical protein
MHEREHGRALVVALLLFNLVVMVRLYLLMADIAGRLHGLGLGG